MTKTLALLGTSALAAAMLAAPLTTTAAAKEGMWTPDQLPDIARDLRRTGLRMNPDNLSDLTGFPMGAVISLGGCTASFVSPQGLVVSNHHCIRGSVQFNSTEENNYLADGFLAAEMTDELQAAPGTRVYVTEEVTDVTDDIRSATQGLAGAELYNAIESQEKAMVASCEETAGRRCQVAAFHGGLQYKLIKRLEIRDVRLVYAPADSIGKYGGDIDNWMWPRHTGDFSFYRAYVGPDGQPADYAEDNVPYQPPHHLKVSAGGLEDGDFVMAAGYPGSTSRYTRLVEVENTFGWSYPTFENLLGDWIETIEETAPEGSDARIKYESRLASLNNYMKNLNGQMEGARRVGLVDRRAAREEALNEWIAADGARANYAEAIAEVDALAQESATEARRSFWYNNATRPQLLGVAQRLYRLAHERQKPDAERESGYQERDMTFFRQGMQAIERRFDPAVDKAEWLLFLEGYMGQPNRVEALDEAMDLGESYDAAAVSEKLDPYYAQTVLTDLDTRLELMEATPEELEAMDDPFMQLAVALYPYERQQEAEGEERAGRSAAARPEYMQAIIDWQRANDTVAYPDANSTLRVTYGTVLGGSPKDGMRYDPFTTLEGILEKDTGEDPFNAPPALLQEIRDQDYGRYEMDDLGSVPVNFLSDLDSTGGNSGSPTLNARGELVGLLFDGTYESVNSDWDFDPKTTRTIHVDTRYMLWVMDKVDGAGNLIEEMEIVGGR